MRQFLFYGDEIWLAGHPAIAAHVFGMKQNKMWKKLDQESTLKVLNSTVQDETLRKAMLYTGDDERWRNARSELTPYFYRHDFSLHDKDMDAIVRKQLMNASRDNPGETELLELLIYITVDLLCQVLYGCELPEDELLILVEAIGEYTVPGTLIKRVYPGGMNALK
jgi:cytochrome P450